MTNKDTHKGTETADIINFEFKKFQMMSTSEQWLEIEKQKDRAFNEHSIAINKLAEIILTQQERIAELERVVYDLAPEFEIIETMADSEEERRELLDSYLNLNKNYAEGGNGKG